MAAPRRIKKPANFDRYLDQEGLVTYSHRYVERLEDDRNNTLKSLQSARGRYLEAERVLAVIKPRIIKRARKAAGL